MVSRIALAWLVAALGLVGGLPGGAAGQGSGPVATRGATIGGDAEARRRAPEDVAAFLRRVLKPETH
jgi:hypothetical protein